MEHEYISAIYSPTSVDTSKYPIENFVVGELINIHSRARRQKRWQARLAAIKESKADFVRAELENLQGRRVQDAKKEGEMRWKLAVRRFLARTRHNRWVQRGGQAKTEMRRERRVKKEKRRRNALRNLQLTPAPNQYIPASA
jgi:5-carboxymethyl-2-hydroxymuconate isomerase